MSERKNMDQKKESFTDQQIRSMHAQIARQDKWGKLSIQIAENVEEIPETQLQHVLGQVREQALTNGFQLLDTDSEEYHSLNRKGHMSGSFCDNGGAIGISNLNLPQEYISFDFETSPREKIKAIRSHIAFVEFWSKL